MNTAGSTISTIEPSASGEVLQVYNALTLGSDQVNWQTGFYQMDLTGPIAGERSPGWDLLDINFTATSATLTSVQLPPVFPSIGQWSNGALIEFGTFTSGGADKSFLGTITSLDSEVVVPEPAMLPILSALLLVSRLAQRRSS